MCKIFTEVGVLVHEVHHIILLLFIHAGQPQLETYKILEYMVSGSLLKK